MVKRFEERFAKLHGLKKAVAASSCSAAIHAALGALQIEPGDEVITTSVTDMGALAPILFQGGIPVFCDLDADTLLPTPESIASKITGKTRAIIVTHLFGLPCDMDGIMKRAGEIPVIEDCAQAPLAEFEGRTVGTFGALSVFSFQQGKHITAGEGGICLCRDETLERRARLFVNKAWPYGEKNPDHEFLALNYRMTELQGAVLLAQLEKLENFVNTRRRLASLMGELLEAAPGVTPPLCPKGRTHSYWRYGILVDEKTVPGGAQALGELLRKKGVPAAPRYIGKPAFKLTVFKERKTFGKSRWPYRGSTPGPEYPMENDADYPGTFKGLEKVLVLPWNEKFTEEHVKALGTLVSQCVSELIQGESQNTNDR